MKRNKIFQEAAAPTLAGIDRIVSILEKEFRLCQAHYVAIREQRMENENDARLEQGLKPVHQAGFWPAWVVLDQKKHPNTYIYIYWFVCDPFVNMYKIGEKGYGQRVDATGKRYHSQHLQQDFRLALWLERKCETPKWDTDLALEADKEFFRPMRKDLAKLRELRGNIFGAPLDYRTPTSKLQKFEKLAKATVQPRRSDR